MPSPRISVAVLAICAAVCSQSMALMQNNFENGTVGSAYTLTEWKRDGWTAPWSLGMETRTMIDNTTPSHSGSKSLRVVYPKGKIGPEDSGAQAPFTLPSAPQYYLSMWIKFAEDFSFGTSLYSGKVGLGLAGGRSCSGGQTCTGTNGFSSRFIWDKSTGNAALYYYHMDKKGTYGDYMNLQQGGTVITWPKGQWVNVVQRVKINTVTNGNANKDGEIEVWFNGQQSGVVKQLRFVTNGDKVDKAYLDSFAGGATTEFAPKVDSHIWYDDIKVSTNPVEICELHGGCA